MQSFSVRRIAVTLVGIGLAMQIATRNCDAAAPQVVRAEPDNGDDAVDPMLKVIRIEFDQDMRSGGYSICGGQGIEYTGKPRWKNKRVFELPVKLQPDQTYQFSVNCPSAQNFKNTGGKPAEIYPITFTTAATSGTPGARPTAEALQQATEKLRKAIDDHYSYRDLRGIDWDARFAEFAPQLAKSSNWAEFTRKAAELLSAAEDPHIWFTLRGHQLGTFQRQVEPNFNPATLKAAVPGWKLHNRMVATGKFDDGIGYVLIASWSARDKEDLAPALEALREFADAPGIILDVRANGGGSELLAREIAGCFVRQPVVYAKNVTRDPNTSGGFTPTYDRTLEPSEPVVNAPVTVLMGPSNMSSCESFLMMMNQAPRATLIGGRSYGSSGNPKPHVLAKDLVVYLPSWKDLRLDGTPIEGQGIEPDVTVEASAADFTAGDPVLERALEFLRSNKSDE